MIIELIQKPEAVELSYVTDSGAIAVESLPLKTGYYKYEECTNFDDEKIENLISFRNKPIKKVPANYFKNYNFNEFLNIDLPNHYPDKISLFSSSNIPKPFSCDIETEINDQYGYSSPEKAENKILSISFTDIDLQTIVFVLKNPVQPEFKPSDLNYIENIVNQSLGSFTDKYDFGFKLRIFETEQEMLTCLLDCISKYFHSLIGWNFLTYDWIYIFNRCIRLGIDVKRASPVFKTTNKTITLRKNKDKENDSIIIKMPVHRLIIDYMNLFKESLIYNNLESYSLNNISGMVLGLNKVMYEGNLRTLYETDYNKFIGYAIIDTILVMLIHKITNLYSVNFFQAYYCNLPFSNISQNNISEALVYRELREENVFLLDNEFLCEEQRKYLGGYVKAPTDKIVESAAGYDFGSLYPNSMLTQGLSPEMKVDSIEVDENFKPKTKADEDKWLKYKAQGCALAPLGRIYDVTKDGLYIRIEKKLLAERKIFKGHANDLYLEIIPKLEEEINKRKNNI